VEDFTTVGILVLKKSYHHSGTSPMRPNKLCTCPDSGADRAQAPGCQRSSCRFVRRGTSEEEISIASNVVKV